METFEQPKIIGYRQLTQEEADLMNKIKLHARNVELLIGEIQSCTNADGRWIAIGTTDLQKGFMALTRAVAKPTSF